METFEFDVALFIDFFAFVVCTFSIMFKKINATTNIDEFPSYIFF